ncbi:Abi family protein, partial [Rhodovulum adriaticum]|uniref:Abi family protein n=1 Tax=Rhodovulum adriaticum TaxID=35804 RepID=UPI001902D50E
IISYKFMEKYPDHGAYLNQNSYSRQERSQVKANIASIEETIQNYMEEENYNRSMKYYKKKYNSIPFWFIVNFVSFGKLVNFYETMDYELREDIADQFQLFVEENLGSKIDEYLTPSHLQSFLQNAREIRNLTAHDNLLLDHKFTEIEFFNSLHARYNLQEKEERRKLFSSFIAIQALLPRKHFDDLQVQIKASIYKLRDNIDKPAFDKIMKSIGFDKWV